MSPSMISKPWYRQSVIFRRLGHALSRAVPGSSHLAWHLCFFAEGGLLYQLRGLTQVFSRPGNEEGGQDACGPHPLRKGRSRWGGTLSPRLGTVRPPSAGPVSSQGTTATIMKANSGSDSDCVYFTRPLEGRVLGLHVQWGPAEEDRNWHASFRPSPLANRAPGGQSPGPARIRGSECGRVQAPCSLFNATAFQEFAKHS